jgi:DNA-binding NarL/FixJ family response regulator
MPGHSGLDVAREVSRLRPDLPLIISSGYLSDELRAHASAAGVRRLLQKENTVEELSGAVHQVLTQAAAERAGSS